MSQLDFLKDYSAQNVCILFGAIFIATVFLAAAVLVAINRRPWRFYSWLFTVRWPGHLQGTKLRVVAGFLAGMAWLILLSPLVVLTVWGFALITYVPVGMAVIMGGMALLLASYSVVLWWRTRWQATRAVSILLLLAIALLCSYEVAAIYWTSGRVASERHSSGAFSFGVSVIAIAVNMLFVCEMVFQRRGLDVEEYVTLSYLKGCDLAVQLAHTTADISLPSTEQMHIKPSMERAVVLYTLSLVVLVIYSVLFGLTAHSHQWLAGVTSLAVVILDANMAACVLSFQLFRSGLMILIISGAYRVFLISFGDEYWYLGHCIAYTVVAAVLLGTAVARHIPVHNFSDSRHTALADTVVLLRTTFARCRQSGASFAHFSQATTALNGLSMNFYEPDFQERNADVSKPDSSEFVGFAESKLDKLLLQSTGMLENALHGCLEVGLEEDSVVNEIGLIYAKEGSMCSLRECTGDCRKGEEIEMETEAGLWESITPLADTQPNVCAGPYRASETIASEGYQNGTKGEAEILLDSNIKDVLVLAETVKEKPLQPIIPQVQCADVQVSEVHVEAAQFREEQASGSGTRQDLVSERSDGTGRSIGKGTTSLILKQAALLFAASPHRAYVFFTLLFVGETIAVAVYSHRNVTGTSHKQFLFGVSAILVAPAIASIVAYIRSLQADNMELTKRSIFIGIFCWLLSMGVGLFIAILSKSSLLLGLAITLPLIATALSLGFPLWRYNGYHLFRSQERGMSALRASEPPHQKRHLRNLSMALVLGICIASHVALGLLVSIDPIGDIRDANHPYSPFETPQYIGWTTAGALGSLITGVLPPIAYFATYEITISSAISMIFFLGILVSFSLGTLFGALTAHPDEWPKEIDLLAAFLPPVGILGLYLVLCGLYKWRDDGWQIRRSALVLLAIGISMLLLATSIMVAFVRPWAAGVALLLAVLLLGVGVLSVSRLARHGFFLTLPQTVVLCTAIAAVAMFALLAAILAGEAFIGASVALFIVLGVVAGWALKVLLGPVLVVYSPRVLPVFVYDRVADKAVDVSGAFLVLYGVGLAICAWGVVATLLLDPPYVGATVLSATLVLAYGFAISRPYATAKMMETALQYLPKDTIVQALKRAISKTCREAMGTHVVFQHNSDSSFPSLMSSTHIARSVDSNVPLAREDIQQLRHMLRMEEAAAGGSPWSMRGNRPHVAAQVATDRGTVAAHAHILALESAIDRMCAKLWSEFGGIFLLIIGLSARTEKIQDDARLRLFLDQIGLADLDASRIKKWSRPERKRFEELRERYMMETEHREVQVALRREEEQRGQQRRRSFLQREGLRRRQREADVLSSMPSASRTHVAAVVAALGAVGEQSGVFSGPLSNGEHKAGLDQMPTFDDVLSQFLEASLQQRALQTGVLGAVCAVNGEVWRGSGCYGPVDPSLCGTVEGSIWADICISAGSASVCILATRTEEAVGIDIVVAGRELPACTGCVFLRITTGPGHVKEWVVGKSSIQDGKWHTLAVVMQADVGKTLVYVDGRLDGWAEGVKELGPTGIWNAKMNVWVGTCGPQNSSEDGVLEIQDAFMWGRCLSHAEIQRLHKSSRPTTNTERQESFAVSEPYEQSVIFDGRSHSQRIGHDLSMSWRKRKADTGGYESTDFPTVGISSSKFVQQPRVELDEEVCHKFRAVELAVKASLVAQGEDRFTDKEFPPNEHSIFADPDRPLRKLNAVKKWLRPDEIVKKTATLDSTPQLFAGKANASDVCQGRLGDCWFLSAVAVLTEASPSRIRNVIITPVYNREGVYTVRFCVQGEWVPVIVDDWIPCDGRGKPTFATSRKANELWVAILEKAYAKLHGSYEALDGGVVQDALVDMTGGAGEEIDMTSAEAQIDLASGRLWSQLLRFYREGFLLGAGSPSGSDQEVAASGIVQGHAYALLQVVEVDGYQLLQVRNPWAGNEAEWKGPWSDSSPLWTPRMRHKLKFTPQAACGVFWMCWQDFQVHFRSLYVCRLYPPHMRTISRGHWRGSLAAGCPNFEGWHRNPQFLLTPVGADRTLPLNVFITLTQGRCSAGAGGEVSLFFIGMRVVQQGGRRCGPDLYASEIVGSSEYVNSREVACELTLPPDPRGYTIVPTTYAPGQEAPFLLSVFTKAQVTLEPI